MDTRLRSLKKRVESLPDDIYALRAYTRALEQSLGERPLSPERDSEWGDEHVLLLNSGVELRHDADRSYFRIFDPVAGVEIVHWNADELAEDPATVVGAMLEWLAAAPSFHDTEE